MTARHHEAQVFAEHGAVQRIALEAAAQKERAALAQEVPHHRQVEIDAGRDVRHGETLAINHIREQQVVHVAAVARHVDDLGAIADVVQILHVLEIHAVVEARPQTRQDGGHDGDEGLRVVGSDLHCVLARGQQYGAPPRALELARVRAPAQLARPRGPDVHLGTHGVAHGLRAHDVCDHGTAVRQIRSDGRCALRAEPGAQSAHRTAHTALRRKVRQRLAQRNRLAEIHHGVAAVEEHVQELAEASEQDPVLGEHQPPQALLFFGRPSQVDRHRNEVDVEGSLPARELGQLHEPTGRMPPTARTEKCALAHEREPLLGRRRAERSAGVVENREIGAALVLEHVADRAAARGDRRGDLVGLDGRLDPQAKSLANGKTPRPSQATERAHGKGCLSAEQNTQPQSRTPEHPHLLPR